RAAAGDRQLFSAFIAVEIDALGRLADVATLARGKRDTEEMTAALDAAPAPVLLERRAVRELPLALAAEAHRLFRLLLVDRLIPERAAHRDALFWVVMALARLPGELRCIEVAVAVIDDARRRAVFEFEKCRVIARRRALRHPLAGDGADAPYHAAAEEAYRVDLVRPLAVNYAPTCFQVQFLRHARAQHPIGEHPGVERAQRTELAGLDRAPHRADRGVEALRVAAKELHFIFLDGRHHLLALFDGERHRLLDDGVLAVVRRGDDVL